MAVYNTQYINLNVETGAYASGDALGEQNSVRVPRAGTIMAVKVIDRDSEEVNLDLVLFNQSFTGTTDNDAFAPSDEDLDKCLGAVLVDTWKTFNANSIGVVDNVGLPYWTPDGTLYFQAVTRGAPTYTATSDVWVSFSILY